MQRPGVGGLPRATAAALGIGRGRAHHLTGTAPAGTAKMSVQAAAGRDVNAGVLVSVVLEALSLRGEKTALGGARWNARRAAGAISERSRGLR